MSVDQGSARYGIWIGGCNIALVDVEVARVKKRRGGSIYSPTNVGPSLQ
jgi:hypothetical protein